jgi:hypothetical protein
VPPRGGRHGIQGVDAKSIVVVRFRRVPADHGRIVIGQELPLTGHLRHLSNKLLELRKRAKAQPGLQIRLKLSVSRDDQRAGAFGLSNSSIAHPNLGHCPQIGDKIKIDIKAMIYRS